MNMDLIISRAYTKNIGNNITDWNRLVEKEIDKDWINATSVIGMTIIKRYIIRIYEVCNYKGKSVKQMWNKKFIEKAVRSNRKSIQHHMPLVLRQLGFNAGTSKVTVYRPLLTKRIVETFGAKNVIVYVLDGVVACWDLRVLMVYRIQALNHLPKRLMVYNALKSWD